MMFILVLRHGISEEPRDAELAGRGEFQRRLTAEGIATTTAVCVGLSSLLPSLDRILCSPLLRARETADILSTRFGSVAVSSCESLAPGGSSSTICEDLVAARVDRLAIVGHEPDLGLLCGVLLSGEPRASVELKKAGAALIRSRSPGSGDGVLVWAMPAGCSAQLAG
jgi:phosphohistidine phosphatase